MLTSTPDQIVDAFNLMQQQTKKSYGLMTHKSLASIANQLNLDCLVTSLFPYRAQTTRSQDLKDLYMMVLLTGVLI